MTGSERADELPADVRKLIDQSIRSVGQLETLLFLFERAEREWSAIELSRELRTNEAYAQHQLQELGPFVEKVDDRFRFNAAAVDGGIIQKLVDLYRERRHAIINYIYAKPPDALRSFADAFRIKKD